MSAMSFGEKLRGSVAIGSAISAGVIRVDSSRAAEVWSTPRISKLKPVISTWVLPLPPWPNSAAVTLILARSPAGIVCQPPYSVWLGVPSSTTCAPVSVQVAAPSSE